MGIFIGIYDSPALGTLLLDASARATNVQWRTGEHGYESCAFEYPMSLNEAFRLYDRPGLPHVLVSDGATPIWEGRLEDVALTDGGIRCTALGYSRCFTDLPCTVLWSSTKVADWKVVDEIDIAADSTPKRFSTDTNNRLFIAAQKNSIQGQARIGYLGFRIPASSRRQIVAVSFDYALAPNTGWQGGLQARTATWAFTSNLWTLASAATMQTGTQTLTFAGTDALVFFYRFNGVDTAYASETGDQYLRITNVRVKTTTNAAVYADEIARDCVATINGNGGLSTSTALIQSPGVDLTNEVYADASMSDVLTKLAALGDNQTPPRIWEWGVGRDRMVYLRPRGSAGRQWFIDTGSLEVERTLENLTNSVYGTYADSIDRETQRTAVQTDAASVTRYGLTRRRAISADIASPALAVNAALTDGKNPAPRTKVTITELFDATGARWPLYAAQNGDTITIRNLSPTLSTSIDRIRTFRVAETEYRADEDTLTVTPEAPLPSLDTLMARLARGITNANGPRLGSAPVLGLGGRRT